MAPCEGEDEELENCKVEYDTFIERISWRLTTEHFQKFLSYVRGEEGDGD
jgi:hypothetical protein